MQVGCNHSGSGHLEQHTGNYPLGRNMRTKKVLNRMRKLFSGDDEESNQSEVYTGPCKCSPSCGAIYKNTNVLGVFMSNKNEHKVWRFSKETADRAAVSAMKSFTWSFRAGMNFTEKSWKYSRTLYERQCSAESWTSKDEASARTFVISRGSLSHATAECHTQRVPTPLIS